jgi:hypothetical protein
MDTTEKKKKVKNRGTKRHRTSPTPPPPPLQTLIEINFNKRSAEIKKWIQSAYQYLVDRCYYEEDPIKEDWLEGCLMRCHTLPVRNFSDGCLVPGCDSSRNTTTLIAVDATLQTGGSWWICLGGIDIPASSGIHNMHPVCGVCETHVKEEVTTFNLTHLPLVRFTSARAKQTLYETCSIPRVLVQLICEYHCESGLF